MTRITIELQTSTVEALSKIAEREHRTLENLIEFLALRHVSVGADGGGKIETGQTATTSKDTSIMLINKHVEAKGTLLPGNRIKVTKGSTARANITRSFGRSDFWAKRLRDQLIAEGTLRKNGDSYIFEKDTTFASPSAAASVICGRSANGFMEWRSVADNKKIGALRL